jgi:hypothetical protein
LCSSCVPSVHHFTGIQFPNDVISTLKKEKKKELIQPTQFFIFFFISSQVSSKTVLANVTKITSKGFMAKEKVNRERHESEKEGQDVTCVINKHV